MKIKFIFLNLSGEIIKIKEPTISELYEIEELSNNEGLTSEIAIENIKSIFKILGVPEKHIVLSKKIIPEILGGFREKDTSEGGNDYFLGILGMLAHHNFMDLKTFCEKYTLSDLKDLLNVREYYFNIINGKTSENDKFNDKIETKGVTDKDMNAFIERLTKKD